MADMAHDALTPLALQNAALLRHLGGADAKRTPSGIAAALGRDDSNVGKSLRALAKEGLVHEQGGLGWFRTFEGGRVVEALDHANGVRAESLVDTSGLVGLRWDQLVNDSLNPRKDFDPEELDGLRQSILRDGLLQNLVVRPAEKLPILSQPVHRIVAGERRWRAIGAAVRNGDWPEDRLIPCKIVAIDDARHTELALIENLRRKDLKPLEEARAFKTLRDLHQLTTETIAEKISMTQRFVQQRLQLLDLDEDDQQFLDEGRISVEEARRRASQPKPEALDLTPGEQQLLAELAHKMEHHPKRKGSWQVETEIDPNWKDPALSRLQKLGVINIMVDRGGTERTYVQRGYNKWDQAKSGLPKIAPATAIYQAAFLNGPFELPAESKKLVDERKAAKAKERADAKVGIDRANRRHGEIATLFDAWTPTAEGPAKVFRTHMKDVGAPLPWKVGRNGFEKAGSQWGQLCSTYNMDPAAVTLLVHAVNAAGGYGREGQDLLVADAGTKARFKDAVETSEVPAKHTGALGAMIGDDFSRQIKAASAEAAE